MNQYSLDIDSIPWHRIITTYGTAKEFPQYFKILWDMDNSTQVKNALSEKSVVYLIAFENISKVGEQYILEDVAGDVIELRNKQQNRDILSTLHYLPDNSYLKQQSLVCEFMYDNENSRIFAIPHTIVTDKTILKLLY